MNYNDLQKVFWQVAADSTSSLISNSNKFIRWKYPVDGQPDWKITDNIIFLNTSEQNDDYGKQINSEFKTENGTVMRYMSRTRVWQVLFTVYGPNSYDIANSIKDGVFTQKIHDNLSKNSVFLVPNLPVCVQSNEMFAGQWWERWDLTLIFNELYELQTDDVGHIESITLSLQANRR